MVIYGMRPYRDSSLRMGRKLERAKSDWPCKTAPSSTAASAVEYRVSMSYGSTSSSIMRYEWHLRIMSGKSGVDKAKRRSDGEETRKKLVKLVKLAQSVHITTSYSITPYSVLRICSSYSKSSLRAAYIHPLLTAICPLSSFSPVAIVRIHSSLHLDHHLPCIYILE